MGLMRGYSAGPNQGPIYIPGCAHRAVGRPWRSIRTSKEIPVAESCGYGVRFVNRSVDLS